MFSFTINRVRKHKFSKRQPIIACDVKDAIMAATDTFLALCPYQTIHSGLELDQSEQKKLKFLCPDWSIEPYSIPRSQFWNATIFVHTYLEHICIYTHLKLVKIYISYIHTSHICVHAWRLNRLLADRSMEFARRSSYSFILLLCCENDQLSKSPRFFSRIGVRAIRS